MTTETLIVVLTVGVPTVLASVTAAAIAIIAAIKGNAAAAQAAQAQIKADSASVSAASAQTSADANATHLAAVSERVYQQALATVPPTVAMAPMAASPSMITASVIPAPAK